MSVPHVTAVQASFSERLSSTQTSLTSPTSAASLGQRVGTFASASGSSATFSVPIRVIGTNSPDNSLVRGANGGGTEKLTWDVAFAPTSHGAVGSTVASATIIPTRHAEVLKGEMLKFENLNTTIRIDGGEDRDAAMLAMLSLGAEDAARRPHQLSGGEQQRVATTRAFAAQPQMILADEPTGSLDRASGQKIVEWQRNAASTLQTTVLVVTHDERIAQQAEHRLEIEDGMLAEIA